MESSNLVKFSTSGKFITKFNVLRCIMSQSIPTGYIDPHPGNPRENFFERANPGHPGNFFV